MLTERNMAGLRVRSLTLALLCGCYLSHQPDDAGNDATADVFDAGTDAPTVDVGLDVPVIVEPERPVTERCDLTRPPTFAGELPTECNLPGAGDNDGDGFANADDCNDCSPQVNPGAFEIPGNGVDENCDGLDAYRCEEVGGPPGGFAAARAIGLCEQTTIDARNWGVLDARITRANGEGAPDNFQWEVLSRLGAATPRIGSAMLSLSNAAASEIGVAANRCQEIVDDGDARPEGTPPGHPYPSSSCPGAGDGDVLQSAALEVRLRVPTNAAGYRVGTNFYTREFPNFICDRFNDAFVILEERAGAWQNVAFDAEGNTISVNNALLEVCRPGVYRGRRFDCAEGANQLNGTGFDIDCNSPPTRETPGGATGWICTDVPASPGELITLRFAIWDTGDPYLSSLALIDGFSWLPARFESVSPE
ncbi:MAG: hypothetical protein ACI9KE_003588 [Polyangiales bacterium]